MKLSICIPTYNRAKALNKTLSAAVAQSKSEDAEIVVSNNASTDNTEDILIEHPVRWSSNSENLGSAANLRRAVEMAIGDYCWLLADDDTIKPGAVAAIMRAIATEPGVVLLNYSQKGSRVMGIYGDMYFKNWGEYFYFCRRKFNVNEWDAAKMTFMSSLVVNRELYLANDSSDKDAPHTFTILKYIADHPVYVIGEPMLEQGYDAATASTFFMAWARVYWKIGMMMRSPLWAAYMVARVGYGTTKCNILKLCADIIGRMGRTA